jgi:tape measure domain-containing protein
MKKVGVQFITDGAQQFFQTFNRANQTVAQFGSQVTATSGQLSAFGSISQGILQGVGQAAFNAGMQGIGAAKNFGMMGITMNAAMEQAQVAFETLLGSAEEAQQFLGELRDFAAATPFEFPGLQDASRRLLAFGFTAEEILPMMTNIGDAVGALGGSAVEINRVVYALGQMRAKGKVANEELMQLAEMGIPVYQILSDAMGKSVGEIQKMVSKGLLPAEEGVRLLTSGFEELYGGSMMAQSQTFNGLLSTLKDNASLALQSFTGPAFNVAKKAIQDLGAAVASPAFQQFAVVVGQKIGSALDAAYEGLRALGGAFKQLGPQIMASLSIFANIAQQARTWGSNIISQLASGMMQAASYVISVVKQIGSIIASWLRPGSPPKILPDLPEWGTEAVNEYMGGWVTPDMSIFSKLSSTIEGALRNLVSTDQLGEADIFSILFGSREALTDAINEFREVGSVSEETFDRIVEAAGPVGPQVEGLVRSYFELEKATAEVSRAQEELNEVTEKYNGILDPLNEQMKALQDRKDEIRDAERIKELEEDLAKGKLKGADAELARLEIEEIRLKNQIEGVEEEKEVAVDAAEEKLKAAEAVEARAAAEVQRQQTQIELAEEQNRLTAEQIRLQKEYAKALEDAAKAAAAGAAGGGGGGGGGGGLGGLGGGLDLGGLGAPSLDGSPIEEVAAAVETLGGAVADTKEAYGEWNAQAVIAKQNMMETLEPVTAFAGTMGILGQMVQRLVATMYAGNVAWQVFGRQIGTISPFLGEMVLAFANAQTPAQGFAAALLEMGVPFGIVLPLMQGGQAILAGLQQSFANVTQVATGFAQTLGLIETPAGNVPTQLQALGSTIATVGTQILTFIGQIAPLQNILFAIGVVIGSSILSSLAAMGVAFLTATAPIAGIVLAIAAAKTAWDSNLGGIQQITQSVMASISGVISSVLGTITQFWDDNGAQILSTVTGQWGPIGEQIVQTMQLIGYVVGQILATVVQFWNEHGAEILSTATGVFLSVSGLIASVMGVILQVVQTILVVIMDFWAEWGDDIMQVVLGAWQFVAGQFQIYSALLSGIFNTFTKLLQGDWSGAWEEIKKALGGALDGLKTMLQGMWNMFSPVLENVWKSFVKWATDMGGDVVGGLVEGIGKNAAKVASSLLDLARNALNKAKEFLGIQSPSTVFYWIGGQIDLGLAKGIENDVPVVMKAMQGMMTSMRQFAESEADAMIKGIQQKLQGMVDAVLEARGGLANAVGRGFGFLAGLVPDADKLFGLQDRIKQIDEEHLAAQTRMMEAQMAAQGLDPQAAESKAALEEALAAEAQWQAALDNRDEVLDSYKAQRNELKRYDEDLQEAIRTAEQLGDFDSAAAMEQEREIVRQGLMQIERGIEDIEAERQTIGDYLKSVSDQRKQIEDAYDEIAGEQGRLLEISLDEEARSAELAKEREETAKALAEETRKQSERERLKFEYEQRLAAVRQKALEMSETDAIEAQKYLEQETAALDQEASLRRAILEEESRAKQVLLEEQLKAVLAAQELERQLYERQAQQRLTARQDELAGIQKEFEEFLYDLSTRPEYGDIGHMIIRGLGEGITEELSKLESVLGSVVGTMIDALKHALQITSPSRLLSNEIGRPSGQGVLQGFAEELSGIGKVVQGTFSSAMNAMPVVSMSVPDLGSMGGGSTNYYGDTNYNYAPTYGSAPRAPSQDFRVMRAMNSRR